MSLQYAAGRIPADLTSFVGRRREITDIRRSLAMGRLVTLTGPGGVGKTRLALRAAADMQRAFHDGVVVVELASLGNQALVAQTIASAVGLGDLGNRWGITALADFLTGKQLLLVLDNCEHLVDACAVIADGLLRALPDLRILATSRQSLSVDGEITMRVLPLAVPETGWVPTAEGLASYDAASLFAERAAAAAPGFTITGENCEAVAAICRTLEGIPLALELAAARIRALSPAEIDERLNDRFRLLTKGVRSAPDRQQTLRALVNWSYELCTEQERLVWARLSVFLGGFDLAAAEYVCAGGEVDGLDVMDLIASLIDKSVVQREADGLHTRYTMLETLRQYGLEELAEDTAQVQRRHRDWFERLIMRAEQEWIGPHQVAWMDRLTSEHANMRAALAFSLTTPGEAVSVLRIAASVDHYWQHTDSSSERLEWLGRALELSQERTVDRAKALRIHGFLLAMNQRIEPARAEIDAARTLAAELGDSVAIAQATQIDGVLAMFAGDLARAGELLDEARPLVGATGLPYGEVFNLMVRGIAAMLSGDALRATLCHEELVEITRGHGELWFQSLTFWTEGVNRWHQGDWATAEGLVRNALRLLPFPDRMHATRCFESLACIAVTAGQAERAAVILGGVERLWSRGHQRPPDFPLLAEDLRRSRKTAVADLGEPAFQAAFRRGVEMSAEDMFAYARDDSGPVKSKPSRAGRAAATELTRREWEIAQLVAQGQSNREIAATLVIALRTAEGHVENILVKLGMKSRAQIAAWVAQHKAL